MDGMPMVTFVPSGKSIEVPRGTNLLIAIQSAELPIGSSCGEVAICGKCYVQILEGPANLSPITLVERKLLEREKSPSSYRMSCVTKVLGDIKITTSYW